MTDERPAGPGQRGLDPAPAIPNFEIVGAAEPDFDPGRLSRETFAQRLHVGFLRGPYPKEHFLRLRACRLQGLQFAGVENVARRLERRRQRLDIDADAISGYGGGYDIVPAGEREMKVACRRDDARGAPRVMVQDDVALRATGAPGDQAAGKRGARGREVARRAFQSCDPNVGATASIGE